MMNLSFTITAVPSPDQLEYAIAYFEGDLKIMVGGIRFFDQPGILVVGLAIEMQQWLMDQVAGSHPDFVYHTMDHDGPILEFLNQSGEGYQVDSLWKDGEVCALVTGR
jgi:hypothetical protein